MTKEYVEQLEDGWARFSYDNTNGTSTVFINAKVRLDAVELKPNTLYTFITEIRNSNISNSSGAFFQIVTANPTVAFQTARSLGYENINAGGVFKGTSTTKESFDGVAVGVDTYLRLAAGTKGTVEARISLVEGNYTNREYIYEPYQESITTIPLLHDMRSLPNGTRDRIYYDNGKWYDEQKISTYTINGNTSFTNYSENTTNGYACANIILADAKITNTVAVLCDILEGTTIAETWSKKSEGIALGANGKYIQVSLAISRLEAQKATAFRTFFGSNNAEVIYELAEPIISEIIDEAMIEALESIRTYKEITYIEADALSILTYYRNVPIVEEYETKASAEKKYKVTEEKFAEQKITNDGIISTVSEVKKTIAEDYMTKEEASTQYSQLKDAFIFDINEAISDLKEEGISKVVTTEVTIDNAGITVGKSDSDFTNTMNNTGTYQYNAGQLVAKYDKDGAEIPRLKSDFAIIAGLKYTKEDVSGVIHHKVYVLE